MNLVEAINRNKLIHWLGLLGLALYCAACAAGQGGQPTATTRPLPSATPILFPTLPPSHTPTATFTATATWTVTATFTPSETPSPKPTRTATTPPEMTATPTEAIALDEPDPILFITSAGGPASRIFAINPDGKGERLILGSTTLQSEPSWSPDHTKVVYAGGAGNLQDIYVLDVATNAVTQLTSDLLADSFPTWSPDGSRIAFVRFDAKLESPEAQLGVVNVDGTGEEIIVNEGVAPARISWSPSGGQIAFAELEDAAEGEVKVPRIKFIGPSGAGLSNLIGVDTGHSPDWSPDGSKLVFLQGNTTETEVFTIGIGGSGLQRVTDGSLDFITRVSWSPDGKRLVFSSGQGAGAELYIVNADGTDVIQLTHNTRQDLMPDW